MCKRETRFSLEKPTMEENQTIFSIEKFFLFNDRPNQNYCQNWYSPPSQVTQTDPALHSAFLINKFQPSQPLSSSLEFRPPVTQKIPHPPKQQFLQNDTNHRDRIDHTCEMLERERERERILHPPFSLFFILLVFCFLSP